MDMESVRETPDERIDRPGLIISLILSEATYCNK